MGSSEAVLSVHTARRRWLGLGVLAVAALTLHLLAFSGLDWTWPQRAVAARTSAVQVRLIEVPPAPAVAVLAAPPIQAVVPAAAVKPAVARGAMIVKPALPARARIEPARVSLPIEPPPEPMPVAPAVSIAPDVTVAAATPAPAVAAVPPAPEAIPRYRTQMPPPIALRYVLQRGGLRGTGEFAWRPAGERYELKLEGSVAGISVLTQVSSGGFDAAGIAPLRFTDQRLRRGTKATNFQRAAGKITFSGPAVEFPLHEGTQDRLSWMVQLGAVVSAEPTLRAVGAKVVMNVVGSNGDLSVWAFDCVASENVETGGGVVNALKFVREPREPYDTQVQVWIDPARHYLPVRATQKSGAGDEVFELRLQSVETTP